MVNSDGINPRLFQDTSTLERFYLDIVIANSYQAGDTIIPYAMPFGRNCSARLLQRMREEDPAQAQRLVEATAERMRDTLRHYSLRSEKYRHIDEAEYDSTMATLHKLQHGIDALVEGSDSSHAFIAIDGYSLDIALREQGRLVRLSSDNFKLERYEMLVAVPDEYRERPHERISSLRKRI
jgi:hypothetical protein